jgi:hypothetical protein
VKGLANTETLSSRDIYLDIEVSTCSFGTLSGLRVFESRM